MPIIEKLLSELHPLDFARLRLINLSRCEEVFHPLNEWSPNDWGIALGGEAGEVLNELKKLRRGDDVSEGAISERFDSIAHELADVIIYADLLAARLGIDLGKAVIEKFNIVSNKRNSSFKL